MIYEYLSLHVAVRCEGATSVRPTRCRVQLTTLGFHCSSFLAPSFESSRSNQPWLDWKGYKSL